MRDGIITGPIEPALLYCAEISAAADRENLSPALLYAIAFNESIGGQYDGKWNAADVTSADGGYGLFQLTYPFEEPWPPAGWDNAATNAELAARYFIAPAWLRWSQLGYVGSDLVRLIAATFNAGFENAKKGHDEGDVDLYTTDRYASRALQTYSEVIAGTFRPWEAG